MGGEAVEGGSKSASEDWQAGGLTEAIPGQQLTFTFLGAAAAAADVSTRWRTILPVFVCDTYHKVQEITPTQTHATKKVNLVGPCIFFFLLVAFAALFFVSCLFAMSVLSAISSVLSQPTTNSG